MNEISRVPAGAGRAVRAVAGAQQARRHSGTPPPTEATATAGPTPARDRDPIAHEGFDALKAASGISAFGAYVIAMGDIQITANNDGLGGVNFMALGRIDAISNSDLGFCGVGAPETGFSIPVFRMAG